jgi:Ca2+-transporting ATPase
MEIFMTYHDITAEESLRLLDTDAHDGLTEKQAYKRLASYGANKLDEKKKQSLISRFAAQFKDFMIIILLCAAAVSLITSILEGNADFADPIIILIIVIVNALLGVIQEAKAEKSLDALSKMSAPTAQVRRGGKIITVPSEQVAMGDIVILRAGNSVPADCRLISSSNLQTDESSLTGESMPAEKNHDAVCRRDALIGDRNNMVYASTAVTAGRGEGLVIAVGMDTEVGKIAGLILSSGEKQTPLQKKLAQVGKILGASALAICAVIFILGLWKGLPTFDMFMTSVSLAVAAIPEGLPAIVTIMLAIGVQRMVRRGAIIRHLPSVETLGSASVICTDKTGTLTQNKMKVTRLSASDEILALRLAALCCDAQGSSITPQANPTENALIDAAVSGGVNKKELDKKYPRIDEIPFDSKRKCMTTIHKNISGMRAVTKGAVDVLLKMCTHYYDNGKSVVLTQKKRAEILSENDAMASDALRVIGIAYREDTFIKTADAEKGLVYVGMFGMVDPPRIEVFDAVKTCRRAGIRPIMVTGDHAVTAAAIAREIGMIGENERAVTGGELDCMSQDELENCIEKHNVFARVTPEHKLRIVNAFKSKGHVVAMTGDGVNDAPALKSADIGCSMGVTGTDVAKSASDMILTDDNFATIVEAVRQGRGIFANIKKAVQFLLSSNIGEILTIFIGLLFGWPPPLAAIQLLWVNLVTDSLPAIALGLDPVDRFIMNDPPRPPKKSLFADGLGITILLEGGMIGALALLAFSIGRNIFDLGAAVPINGRTMAFAVLSISQLIHAFNMRSEKSLFSIGAFSNKYLIGALIAGVILQVSVIMLPPLAPLFGVHPLSGVQWLIVAVLSVMPLLIIELQKRFSK